MERPRTLHYATPQTKQWPRWFRPFTELAAFSLVACGIFFFSAMRITGVFNQVASGPNAFFPDFYQRNFMWVPVILTAVCPVVWLIAFALVRRGSRTTIRAASRRS